MLNNILTLSFLKPPLPTILLTLDKSMTFSLKWDDWRQQTESQSTVSHYMCTAWINTVLVDNPPSHCCDYRKQNYISVVTSWITICNTDSIFNLSTCVEISWMDVNTTWTPGPVRGSHGASGAADCSVEVELRLVPQQEGQGGVMGWGREWMLDETTWGVREVVLCGVSGQITVF